jgi:hypothetical protein
MTQELNPRASPSAARFGELGEGVSQAVDVGGVGRRAGVITARRLVPKGVGWLQADGLVEALVDVAAGIVGEVLADVDDDGDLGFGEGEEESPSTPEVHHAEPLDARAGEAVAGGVAADPLEGLDGGREGGSGAAPQSRRGLATGRRPGDTESLGGCQSCALVTNS